MSIDRCKCGNAVDTDFDAEAYEFGDCMCKRCRETNDCDACGKHPAVYHGQYQSMDTSYCAWCAGERT